MGCEAIQIQIDESLDDDRPLDAGAAAHVARCSACAAHQRAAESLARGLRAEAQRLTRFTPPGLEARTLRAIESRIQARVFPWWRRIAGPVLALAACMALAALAAFYIRPAEVPMAQPQTTVPAPVVPAPSPEVPDVIKSNPVMVVVNDPARVSDPLIKERERLMADMKAAESYLLNCIAAPEVKNGG